MIFFFCIVQILAAGAQRFCFVECRFNRPIFVLDSLNLVDTSMPKRLNYTTIINANNYYYVLPLSYELVANNLASSSGTLHVDMQEIGLLTESF